MKNKKVLLLGTFALVFTSGLAAVGSTYAWYQTNRSASLMFGGAAIESQDSELKLTFIESQNSLVGGEVEANKFEFDAINRVTDVSGDGIDFYKPYWSSKKDEAVAINKVGADGHYIDLFFKIERVNQDGVSDAWGLKVYLGEDTKFEPVNRASERDIKSLEALRFAVVGYEDERRVNPKTEFIHAPHEEANAKYLTRTDSYSAVAVQEIISAQAAAIANIKNAGSIMDVALAKNAGVTTITAIERLEPSDEVESAKLLAIEVIKAEVASLKESNYSVTDWGLILTAKDNAINEIGLAGTVGGVNTARNDGVDAIGAIGRIPPTEKVAAAKEVAIAAIEAHAIAMDELDYDPGDWTAIEGSKTSAIANINGALNVADVIVAKNNGIAAINLIKNSKPAGKLATIKLAAVAAINAEVDVLDEADFDPTDWLTIQGAQTAALTSIGSAVTIAEVHSERNDGITAINAVLPITALDLAEAKQKAIAVIDAGVASLSSANYSSSDWLAIEAAQDEAIENIIYASSIVQVANIKNGVVNSIYSIEPNLPLNVLSEEKQAAVAVISAQVEALNALHDYSDDGWAEIVDAQEVAILAINGALNSAGIAEAKEDGIVALNEVEPLAPTDLADAKEAAIKVIDELVTGLGEVAYKQPGYILKDQNPISHAFKTADKQADATYEIADLSAKKEAYVAFRVWVEGEDAQAVRDAGTLGGMFKFNLDIYALTDDVWN